jgi:hypothetical protein
MFPSPGKVLSVKDCAAPLTVAFDGMAPQPIYSGTVLYGPFRTLQFVNPNTVPVTVNFFVGDNPVNFAPATQSQSNSKSYLFGNLGVITAGSIGGVVPTTVPPAADANGFLQITANMRLLVSGVRNGARRQVLILSVDPGANATYSLSVMDANSGQGGEFAAITLKAGAQIELLTDSDIILSGNVGTIGVTIGQIFLTAS